MTSMKSRISLVWFKFWKSRVQNNWDAMIQMWLDSWNWQPSKHGLMLLYRILGTKVMAMGAAIKDLRFKEWVKLNIWSQAKELLLSKMRLKYSIILGLKSSHQKRHDKEVLRNRLKLGAKCSHRSTTRPNIVRTRKIPLRIRISQ
jgi:hypothetical protein